MRVKSGLNSLSIKLTPKKYTTLFEYSTVNCFCRMVYVNCPRRTFKDFHPVPKRKIYYLCTSTKSLFSFQNFLKFFPQNPPWKEKHKEVQTSFLLRFQVYAWKLFHQIKYVIFQDYLPKFCQSITWGFFVIPSSQKPTERRKTFSMWYVRIRTNNVYGTKYCSIWQTS